MNEAYNTPFMRVLLEADPHCIDDDGRQDRYRERSRDLYHAPEPTMPTAPVPEGLLCTGDEHESYS